MKLYCPLISGLLLSFIFFRDSSEDLSVIQSPSSITVDEGQSAQINCCWNETIQNAKVAWYIKDTKQKQDPQEHTTQNCTALNLTNILKNASGHYVCELTQDIPILHRKNGSGTVITVNGILAETTTTVNVHTLSNPAGVKPDVQTNPEGSSRDVVLIYIFRSLPFICLLVAFFYLNRDKKQVTASRPAVWTLILTAPIHCRGSTGEQSLRLRWLVVEHAVESGERPDEDLEAGDTQRSETEEAKRSENVPEQEKKMVVNNQKPEVTATTEEEKDEEKQIDVVVDTERGTSPVHDDEKNKIESVVNTDKKTHLMTDAEEVTVSVLGGIVSAL
ncbi:uncharacterized protein LOC127941448 isoform X1 [Carassius gibelio]|uniref:uncharacterized protein LOC127941448 isoform X1 n=1 Tax=Carassius gibelio TaxID=101364 RepID=UPI00227893B8|nr:uncharacterized protein LOC127941448 isoform X1 [Carassius gibelio]